MKKLVSVVLAVLILVSSISIIPCLNAFADYDENNLSLSVSTDKKKYKWGDKLVFSISVTNNSSKTLENITVSSIPKKVSWFAATNDSDKAVIDSLTSGETKTVKIMFKISELSIFTRLVLLPWITFFDMWGTFSFERTPFDKIMNVKVGIYKFLFGFYCSVGSSKEETNTQTDEVVLTYNYGIKVDGSYPANQTVKKGGIPEEPEMPEADGYYFRGWYADKYFLKPYYFADEMYENTEIYAKWEVLDLYTEKVVNEQLVEMLNESIFGELKTGSEVSDFTVSAEQAVKKATVDYELENGTSVIEITEADGIINNVVGRVGTPIDVVMLGEDTLKSATISFEYSEDDLPVGVREEDLGIIWYNEEENKMVLLENVTVDTEKNLVSYVTEHFSEYVLVDTKVWTESWAHKQLVSRIDGKTVRFNIVLCLDDSGSMSGTPANVCKQAAKNFVDQLVDGDNISVIRFTNSANVIVNPTEISTTTKETVKNKISLSASGGTNFDNAVYKSIEMLLEMEEKEQYDGDYDVLKSYIVFISDGQSTVNDTNLADLVKWGFNVLAIGVGNSVSSSELQKMANASGGSYTHVSDPNNIASIFEQLQGEYIGLSKDSDGDMIADLVETTGMIATDGHIYRTDPNDSDTDGDGLSDSCEMGAYNDVGGYFAITSDPLTPTYVDSKAKLIKSGDIRIIPKNYKETAIEAHSSADVTASFKAADYKLAWDYLNDTIYPNAVGVEAVLYLDGKAINTDRIAVLGRGQSVSYKMDLNNLDIKEHTIKLVISASNADPIIYETKYNPYDYWISAVNKSFETGQKKLQEEATKVIKKYAQTFGEQKNNIENYSFITLSSLQYLTAIDKAESEAVMAEVNKKIGSAITEKIEELTDKGKNKPKDIYDFIKKLITDKVENDFSIETTNGIYDVEKTDYVLDLYGTIKATNAKTGKSFSYVFSTDQKTIERIVDSFYTICSDVYDKAMDELLSAALSDAAAILEIDQIKDLVRPKIYKKIDEYLKKISILDSTDISAEKIKNAYDYFDKAKSAVEAARKSKNLDIEKVNGTVSALHDFMMYPY